jgi:hypothetical protein
MDCGTNIVAQWSPEKIFRNAMGFSAWEAVQNFHSFNPAFMEV